jgi:hypothetical protein
VNSTVVIIAIVAFLALDLVFYYLIIRQMDRPSPSAAFARARDFSVIPDSEGESVGLRLRETLPIPRGYIFDIVSLPLPNGEGYLFTTLPPADSRLPKARENQRQFIAVLAETPADCALFLHSPVRPPLAGYKRRRLFRVFKTGEFSPVSADRLPPALARRYRVRAERPQPDLRGVFTDDLTNILAVRAPRVRGFGLFIHPGGLVIYISPLLKDQQEAGRFCDFAGALVTALTRK